MHKKDEFCSPDLYQVETMTNAIRMAKKAVKDAFPRAVGFDTENPTGEQMIAVSHLAVAIYYRLKERP